MQTHGAGDADIFLMGELITRYPQFEGLVDQVLPEGVQLEDDGTGSFGEVEESDDDADAATAAAKRRQAAKRKGREGAQQREVKLKSRVKAREREAVSTAEAMASSMVRGFTPLLSGSSGGSSKWSEATQKTESEQAELALSLQQMDAHKVFSDELAELEKAGRGSDFRATFLKVKLQQLEAQMLPPETSSGSAANGGSGTGAGGGAGSSGSAFDEDADESAPSAGEDDLDK